ncbi:SAM-dependent methyltransferase [Streptacidiphilus melanogenes]|uniref:SAM-dependent methyltransferase n=1 Tax=Streptacidiphilus melanogenes TaxID=411235 RepID=UPI000694F0A1|nr:SAM-dependent methyltransferase [Streptacidiphilus melanogenes]
MPLAAEEVLGLCGQQLRESVAAAAHELVTDVMDRTGSCLALDLGAGKGILTGHLAAAGCEVEAVTASDSGAAILRHRFRHNPRVSVLFDPHRRRFAIGRPLGAAVCVSDLPLDPDYLFILRQLVARLRPAGSLLCTHVPPAQTSRRKLGLVLSKSIGILKKSGREGTSGIDAGWAFCSDPNCSGHRPPHPPECAGMPWGLTADCLAAYLKMQFRHVDVRYHTSFPGLPPQLGGSKQASFTIMATDLQSAFCWRRP